MSPHYPGGVASGRPDGGSWLEEQNFYLIPRIMDIDNDGINPEAAAQFPAHHVSTMTWHLFTERVHVPISVTAQMVDF